MARASSVSPRYSTSCFGWPRRLLSPAASTIAGIPINSSLEERRAARIYNPAYGRFPRQHPKAFAVLLPTSSRRQHGSLKTALANANQNPGRNTYLWRDPAWTRDEAARAENMPASEGGAFGDGRDTLWGCPYRLKDCFDLAGSPTNVRHEVLSR